MKGISREKFAARYFADHEVETAQQKDDPVQYLAVKAKGDWRGFHAKGEISYSTYSGEVEIYMPGSNITEDPDFTFSTEELAEARIKSLTQPDMFA